MGLSLRDLCSTAPALDDTRHCQSALPTVAGAMQNSIRTKWSRHHTKPAIFFFFLTSLHSSGCKQRIVLAGAHRLQQRFGCLRLGSTITQNHTDG